MTTDLALTVVSSAEIREEAATGEAEAAITGETLEATVPEPVAGTGTIITAQEPDQMTMATIRGKTAAAEVTVNDTTAGMVVERMMAAADSVANDTIVVQDVAITMAGECNERRSCRMDGNYQNVGWFYI